MGMFLASEVFEDTSDIVSELNLNRRVPIRSLHFGKVVYINSVNKSKYVWKEFGSKVNMTIAEIQSMHNEKPAYFETPYLFTNDKELIEYYNLEDKYKDIRLISGLGNLFNSGQLNDIRVRLGKIKEVGLRDVAVAKIRKLREDKLLTNIDVIDIIKDVLNVDIE